MGKDLIHIQKKRSWWDGRWTAWCGWTRESSKAKVVGWFASGPECQACKDAKKAGR